MNNRKNGRTMNMLTRRQLVAASAAVLAAPAIGRAQDTPGVTATEIRIGSTNSLSGPLSAYSVISRSNAAMFKRVNDQGGINGRKVTFIVYDDGFQPPKTLEQARRIRSHPPVSGHLTGWAHLAEAANGGLA
jgi:branched-chain amino acid transport system substrate-binding protein